MFRCWVEVSLRFDFLFLQTFGNPTTRILSVDAGNVVDQLRLERSVDFRALRPQIRRLGDIFAEIEQGKIGSLKLAGKGRPIRRVIPPDVGPEFVVALSQTNISPELKNHAAIRNGFLSGREHVRHQGRSANGILAIHFWNRNTSSIQQSSVDVAMHYLIIRDNPVR